MKKRKVRQILAMLLSMVLIMTTIVSPSATVFATTATNVTRSITLEVKSKVTMYLGTSRKIKVKSVTPKRSSRKVTYESSDPSVVKVSGSGKMKALREGQATITVTSASNPEVYKEVKVTVKNLVKNKTYNKMVIALDKKPRTKKLSRASRVKTSYLKFSSSKKKVATVSAAGVVIGKKAGVTKITVKGRKSIVKGAKQVITLYVAKKSVETVALNKTSVTLKPEEKVKLATTVTPEEAANVVVYTTSDEKVAAVNQDGEVTALQEGTAEITATTVDGSKKAVCVVTVSNGSTEKATEAGGDKGSNEATTENDKTETTPGENTGNTTGDKTEATTEKNTGNTTGDKTEATTGENQGNNTEEKTEATTGENPGNTTEDKTEATTEDNTENPSEPVTPETLTTTDMYEKVPYVSTYYFEPKPDCNEDVIIPIYITDYEQSEYLKNDDTKTIDLLYEVDGEEHYIRNMKLGDNEVNLGKLPEGEHYFALQAIDRTSGLRSHKLYNDLLAVDPEKEKITAAQTYTITDEDLAQYSINKESSTEERDMENTRNGLNQLFVDIQQKGYRKCILPKGTYRISSLDPNRADHISIPSYLTVDMNGSTFKLDTVLEDRGAILVTFDQAIDAHLVNGTVEGDRFERKELGLEQGYLGEGINTIGIGGGKYCSIDNLVVKNTTGHTFGVTGVFEAGVWPSGFSHVKIVDGEEVEDESCSTCDMADITKIKEKSDYVMVGECFGYRGLKGESPIVYIHFYDEDEKFLETVTAYQYRKIRIPENAKYARATYLGDVQTSNTAMFFYKDYGSYHSITNIDFYDTRTTAIASAGNNILIENCTYTRCGNSITPSSVDFEDGYQECQDIYYRNNIDKERPGTATVIDNTGYNHVYENLKGHSMHLRTGNVGCVVRNVDDIEGTEIRWTTGNIRTSKFCRNYNNKTRLNDMTNGASEVPLSEHKVKNCVMASTGGTGSINSILYEDCIFYNLWGRNIVCRNCTIYETGYLYNNIYFYDCIFGKEDSEEEIPIRINHVDGERIFENCRFKGKTVIGSNNSAKFTKCVFDDVRLIANLYPEEQTSGVVYDDCTMFSSAENFMHIGVNAYSRDYMDIVFNNCKITHTGERFMYLYGKPVGNSKMEFHNCEIVKDTGVLLGGWLKISDCPETSLQILFDNTTFSKELDDSYAEDQSKVKILYSKE